MQYWLVKSEPEAYSWADLVKDGKTAWTGIRSFAARLNLRAMKKGDSVLFYHSVSDKQIVGIARVEKEAYPDSTATEGEWVAVDLAPAQELKNPVNLGTINADKLLKNIALVKQGRLSVVPLSRAEFERVIQLSQSPVI
jgi:predicted RNA-binding protein with PUA-like domain